MAINPEILYRNSHRNVSQVSMNFKLELHHKINWDARIIGIKGPKGVGKSTLLKQHIKEAFPDDNQVGRVHELNAPPMGDFLIDGKHAIEVGGADKGFEQIKNLPDSYLAIDDVEFGRGNKIPLWLFGFLY